MSLICGPISVSQAVGRVREDDDEAGEERL